MLFQALSKAVSSQVRDLLDFRYHTLLRYEPTAP